MQGKMSAVCSAAAAAASATRNSQASTKAAVAQMRRAAAEVGCEDNPEQHKPAWALIASENLGIDSMLVVPLQQDPSRMLYFMVQSKTSMNDTTISLRSVMSSLRNNGIELPLSTSQVQGEPFNSPGNTC